MSELPASLAAVDPLVAEAREGELRRILRELPGARVAFSAGVDSSYLLAIAAAELGDRVRAVTADSASLARGSLAEARAFCAARGILHEVVATDEFERERYLANDGMRCYECKAALFRAMEALLARDQDDEERPALLIGALVEDFADHRPGLQAAREAGARWPLAEVGLDKPAVRYLSWRLGLPTWQRPAEPCLSSRIPYGERVDPAVLAMIERAEALLHAAGFATCRARHHRVGQRGHLCRIEVPVDDLARILEVRARLEGELRALGYHHVAVDLGGLQSGGFNRLLGGAR